MLVSFSMSWESSTITPLFITRYTWLIYSPFSTVSADQVVVGEKLIRIDGND